MFFNSYSFIFLFLPLVWIVFKRLPASYRLKFLIVVSLLFYGLFSCKYLLILLMSISFNYSIAHILTGIKKYKRIVLGSAIAVNLLPLVYFKYTLAYHTGVSAMLFPLGISFYTFQQIAFLIDVFQKKVTLNSIEKYLFFVLFFPQLVAGPIVHYKELISQVTLGALKDDSPKMLETGLFLFIVGLFKKVAIADSFFILADHSFESVDHINMFEAWIGLLGYSLGIYFDFSAYSDMAIGLGFMFGILLPMNFNSPYKAPSLIDFWRRWHITLSEFLKQYLYIPLGGNRHGKSREIMSLVLTMSIAGIWHGTGWTFLLWGFAHGILLICVHFYSRYDKQWALPNVIAIGITFTTVTLLWVLFRAHNLEDALTYYSVLFSWDLTDIHLLQMLYISFGLFIVWFLPNSMDIIRYPYLKKLNYRYALWAAALSLIAFKIMAESPAQSFVYFNF